MKAGDDLDCGTETYLAAPDPVWFAALDRACQARSAQRAGPAVRLGQLEVGRELGEPQLRVLALAGQRAIYCPRLPGEQGHHIIGHDVLPIVAVRDRPSGTCLFHHGLVGRRLPRGRRHGAG